MTGPRAFLADENGTATIEFVFIIPIVMTIFMAAFESGLFMARHVMLERSVDIVVRDIRLGNLDYLKTQTQAQQHATLKNLICSESALVSTVADCVKELRIWMQPISTANFHMIVPPRYCVDKLATVNPSDPGPPTTEFALGSDNQIMLMRICLKEDPLFPTTVVGADLVAGGENDGSYALQTTTIFVNEPG
jgi:hypothetical protein